MRARIGQDVPEPVRPERVAELRQNTDNVAGGLIVIGSHVPTTTRQLARLKETNEAPIVEMDVARVIGEGREDYIAELASEIEHLLIRGNVISVSYTHLTLPTILRSCRSRWSPYH